ncbi:DNA polymerase I [Bacillus pseudomycoides]|uniref:DNA polymerase I n=1 Tax=Bacillus pseudomycoides TaxID=64104 RepID=A0AA91ZRI4_9BACI|nr:DNA polymerase I [Bacillus sp. AFS098217]PED80665.1 DNA polymerase I [Bacillus pseudomycoides]PEU17018.1 DNA polymerase I [Bacillus sp. AFS019443]PEU20904.1 DNA polymerase I [Bacillus sp. AFS014408]PFW59954.1 DNA polymerase I [Bacillus sp. AFS075034]
MKNRFKFVWEVSNLEKKVVLVDGNNIAYRAFFALPLLNNDKGIHTNAIYGFTMMLMRILEEEKPTHMLVAFDAGKTTFRHKTFSEYKGGRQKTPPELSEQFPFIRELLDAFHVPRYELENYEADDIMGTLAKEASEQGAHVKVISGDKDLLQLVSDNTLVCIPRKGITEVDEYTKEALFEKYSLSPKQIIDMKGLMGDQSDNIPGVPGVGEKTAIKLLTQFETVEAVYENLDKVSGKKLKEKLEENKEQALMSKELATIITDAPITVHVDDIEYKGYEASDVIPMFENLGFTSLLNKLGATPIETAPAELDDISFDIAEEVTEEMLQQDSAIIVEVQEENYHKADIQGFGIQNENGCYFIPSDVALQSEAFTKWLANDEMRKYTFDAKRAIVALKWKGVEIKGIDFDLLIAAYLLDPADTDKDFRAVAKMKETHAVKSDEEVYGKGAKRAVPEQDIVAEHVARKVHVLYDVQQTFVEELEKNEQYELFTELEMPLARVLAEMEVKGVMVDTERLRNMGDELAGRLKEMEQEIYELAGTEFNINSPKQLGVVLFETLNLPVIKKTKTGYSTSADVLDKLMDHHEIIPKILHYRQLGKLNSTYIEGLLKVVHEDSSKIHTRFNQVLTQTGRLSSTDPNLQNIPIRLEEGRKIRQAFVPSKEGWIMYAADYSQIELRVLAHIAKDKGLVEAFQHDMDIHTKTAMDVFGVGKNEVTSNMRRQAKAVNFGIVYGISDYGLSQNLGITRKAAGEFIEKYFASFPGVKEYMDEIVQEAKQKGYVSTLLNRRRYIPEITSRNFNLRSFAERTAMNTPIQGSAADIIKKAMIIMADRLEEEGLQARLLLQVHDELIFEVPKEEVEKLEKLVPEVMEHAIELVVPLKVDYSYGPTWYDAK